MYKPTNQYMKDKVLLSVSVVNEGLEIKISEDSYGNLALVGVLEKIKLALITEQGTDALIEPNYSSKQTYDA